MCVQIHLNLFATDSLGLGLKIDQFIKQTSSRKKSVHKTKIIDTNVDVYKFQTTVGDRAPYMMSREKKKVY